MTRSDQHTQARALRALHANPPLVLPNAWDPASAVAIEAAGATAIATTSGGVSWAAGVADGGGLSRADALDALRRIVAAVSVPVTADIESGYGDVASTITEVLATGAVGVNIEDRVDGKLLEPSEQGERLAVARKAAQAADIDLCINARTDTYLLGVDEPLAETMARAEHYAAAGADVLFVPGVVDPTAIRTLVTGPLPINIMVYPGAPTIAELAALGVTRISVGSGIAQAAYALAAAAARELLSTGTYTSLENALGYGELNELLT